MATYTITLTDAEDKALGHIAYSQDAWIQNAVKERCRIAIEQIIAAEVQRLLDAGEPIPSSRDEIVLQAPIKTAAQIHDENVAAMEAQMAEVRATQGQ